ncbi:MAG: heat-inducible transcriptional repressor HrcA [Actinomycetia bacterium]|nr:heat-inducible transcriptional repressor HrcA [Actinomycetes bacterium]
MDTRKARVLSAVIDDYIASAEPVASRTLARRHAFGLSPATLRNELADLEEEGYLDKPHTSAGRVPSDKGYRYYVDRLLVRPALDPEAVRRIREAYRARVREVEWFLHQTAKVVSAATRYPSLVVGPALGAARLRRLSFVPLAPGTAVVVVETDSGWVESRVVSVPDELDAAQLERIARLLSEELGGVPLAEIASQRLSQLVARLGRYAAFVEELLEWIQAAEADEHHVTVEGALRLLDQPEFHNPERVRHVWDRLGEDAVVRELFEGTQEDGVAVRIGRELPVPDLTDLSVVSVRYRLGGRAVGQVAVVGPRRMDYGRVMVVLEEVAEALSQALNWI